MRISSLVVSLCLFTSYVNAQGAWFPNIDEFTFTQSISYQRFDQFWAGEESLDFPGTAEQFNALATLEYGLWEDWALDFTSGYSLATGGPFEDNDGLSDTNFGIRWRFLNEWEHEEYWMPTLAFRVGGIIEGTYNVGSIVSPGDGASGAEFSLLMGKSFGDTGFGLYGDVGYRIRNENVPDDFFTSIGVFKSLFDGWTASLGYRHVRGLSGIDLPTDPGVFFDRFPEAKEIVHEINTGISYTDNSGRTYSFFYARTLDGRNTPERDAFNISVSFPF